MSARDRLPIRGAGGGGGKSGGGSASAPTEAPDSLRSRALARVLDLIGEGEIEGLVNGARSIFLDDTPLVSPDGTANFQGVAVETRNGTQAQSYIAGFPSVESETVVGVESTYDAPVVRSITNPNVNAVRVTVGIPQLLEQQSSGDIVGTSVDYAIDVQSNGGGYVAQNIGTTYMPGTYVPGAATVDGTVEAPGVSTAFQGVVMWTRPSTTTLYTHANGDIETVAAQTSATIEVQYRVRGSGGAWTTCATLELAGSADGETVYPGHEPAPANGPIVGYDSNPIPESFLTAG